MNCDSEEVAEQSRQYSISVGRGLPSEQLADIIEFSRDADLKAFYRDNRLVPFWFECYDKEGLTEKLKLMANAWVQNKDNIKRAAAQVTRPEQPAEKLVIAFGIYRFKKFLVKEHWELVQRAARGPSKLKADESQTMVCVALEDIGPEKGFLFELKCGQDVCIDGADALWLPPTGGGLAMLIWIRL